MRGGREGGRNREDGIGKGTATPEDVFPFWVVVVAVAVAVVV